MVAAWDKMLLESGANLMKEGERERLREERGVGETSHM